MAKKMDSPAVAFLEHIWMHSCKATPFAFERLNHAMRKGLSLAIGSGMEFRIGDFTGIDDRFRPGHWIGVPDEWVYAYAVSCGNRSAWKAWEKYKGRPPFLANDTDASGNDYVHSSQINRKRGRLALGSRFAWQGHHNVRVTSFSDDGTYLTACLYEWVKEPYPHEKVVKRFKITREDLATAFPAPKKPKKARNDDDECEGDD